ncbi:MAG: hypothetical protein RIB78_06070 [Gammaproteobacteria bacterium]
MSVFFTKLTTKVYLSGLFFAALHGLAGCATQARMELALETGPFLGIETRPNATGDAVMVDRLWPGPVLKALQQDIRIDIRRDVLVSIDGTEVNPENFRQIVARLTPGQPVTLGFIEPDSSETEMKLLRVVTGDRNDWTGPITKHDASSYASRQKTLPLVGADTGVTGLLKTTVTEQGLVNAVADLHQLFADWQSSQRGFHSLSRVLYPFQQPYRLTELQQQVSLPLLDIGKDPQRLLQEVARNLDLAAAGLPECKQVPTFSTMVDAVNEAQEHLLHAFPGWGQDKLDQVYADLRYLLEELTRQRTLERQLFPERSLNAMNSSMLVDYEALLTSAAAFSCLINNRLPLTLDRKTSVTLPVELTQAITGEIKAAIKTERGWVVYGGEGDNQYDLQHIAAVYDPGGNDIYRASGYQAGSARLIIDQAGDDRYEGDHAGPGSAWLGISIVIDHDGDDIYVGELAANGSGMMGIGILIDRAGNDIYTGNYFSNGAAFYGAGLLIDLGTGSDSYQSWGFSQGLGGPRALGLIYDEGGDDHYQANYRMPSVYGTENVFAGFSQGFGFGIRHYDSGGIGVIVDKQGNDHYDAGEFSQGGAYYWGLGILHDHAGDDIYQGNRYSQGFGVHQASGVLRDDAGHDQYQGMTAACQGAAWDVALGLLIDVSGDDRYQGDELCQGAAAMQAQAWLVDLDGQDTYSASGGSIQGNSGRNHYHYDPEQPVYSWSVLVDAGKGEDRFSSGRQPGEVSTSSQFDELAPGNSRAYGLFIDLPARLVID